MLAVPNQLIADMASARHGLSTAKQWLQTNMVPYANKGVHFIALAVRTSPFPVPRCVTRCGSNWPPPLGRHHAVHWS